MLPDPSPVSSSYPPKFLLPSPILPPLCPVYYDAAEGAMMRSFPKLFASVYLARPAPPLRSPVPSRLNPCSCPTAGAERRHAAARRRPGFEHAEPGVFVGIAASVREAPVGFAGSPDPDSAESRPRPAGDSRIYELTEGPFS
jgi:hypothetical protein